MKRSTFLAIGAFSIGLALFFGPAFGTPASHMLTGMMWTTMLTAQIVAAIEDAAAIRRAG